MNNKAGIHLVLISDQAVPNLTPILDRRFKPEQVIMLVSEDKQKQAAQLEKIYRNKGIKVSQWSIENPWDIEYLKDRIMDLMIDFEDKDITLNATGGTKPMSIAAYEVFRALNKAIFYIHPEKDRLIWLYPGDKTASNLEHKIKLKEFLIACGAEKVSETHKSGVPATIRTLTGELINHIEDYSPALSTINYLAAMAQGPQLKSPEIDKNKSSNHHFWKLIELFQQAGLLTLENNSLHFPDEDARFMVNGGWLEMHAYACCLNIKKELGIQDIAHSIEIIRKQKHSPVMNEIDVGLLHNNRLYLLECKTKKYHGRHLQQDDGAETLYKLDSLRDLLGGLQAKAMLVSVTKLKSHHLARANELKINCCTHRDLKNLQHHIKNWIQNAT